METDSAVLTDQQLGQAIANKLAESQRLDAALPDQAAKSWRDYWALAILIELNPEYSAMAEKRIRGDSPMFAEVTA